MIDFFPTIVLVASLIVIFFMLKAVVVHFANELAAAIEEYSTSTAQISKQLEQIQRSIQSQAASISEEFQNSLLQYQKSQTILDEYVKNVSEALKEIKMSANRQQELEAEIIRLKSILARKEKRNASK
jgi:septal ring factor EnvC (AmiA/AmiB activator)